MPLYSKQQNKNIAYLPLDLPYLKVSQVKLRDFLCEFGRSTKRWKHAYSATIHNSDFKEELADSYEFVEGLCWSWKKDFKSTFPEIVTWYEKFLPFKSLSVVLLLQSRNSIDPHKDFDSDPINKRMHIAKYMSLEPANYKCLLFGLQECSFFVCDNSEGRNKKYIKLPADTNSFLVSACSWWHGSTQSPTPKLILYLGGSLDAEKHFTLVNKSINKYQKYSILF